MATCDVCYEDVETGLTCRACSGVDALRAERDRLRAAVRVLRAAALAYVEAIGVYDAAAARWEEWRATAGAPTHESDQMARAEHGDARRRLLQAERSLAKAVLETAAAAETGGADGG